MYCPTGWTSIYVGVCFLVFCRCWQQNITKRIELYRVFSCKPEARGIDHLAKPFESPVLTHHGRSWLLQKKRPTSGNNQSHQEDGPKIRSKSALMRRYMRRVCRVTRVGEQRESYIVTNLKQYRIQVVKIQKRILDVIALATLMYFFWVSPSGSNKHLLEVNTLRLTQLEHTVAKMALKASSLHRRTK